MEYIFLKVSPFGWGIKMKCSFCGFHSDDPEDFEMDEVHHKGYWCPHCDGFTYNEKSTPEHSFRLLYEVPKKEDGSSKKPSFPTQVSPLRYPGGKSRLVGQILQRCNPEKMESFAEPFAGGASVGLSFLLAGKVQELYLNDLDFGIYSLFEVIKSFPWILLDRIDQFSPCKKEYIKAQEQLKNGYDGMDMVDAAWNLLIVKRLAYSGIAKANCMSEPAARWNRNTLRKKILAIHGKSEHLHVTCMDACAMIEEMYWKDRTTIFIDPPYHKKGKDLYLKYYQNADHEKLAFLLDELYKGMPGADLILTYDNSQFIRSLYHFPFEEEIGRKYCI